MSLKVAVTGIYWTGCWGEYLELWWRK